MFSPEFVLDRIYEIDLYTSAGGSNTETFEFVDRTPESIEEIIEPFESIPELSIEEQQKLQQEESIRQHAEIKAQQQKDQEELEQNITSEPITENIVTNNPIVESEKEIEMDPEPVMDPEPTPEHTEKKCGLGTELVDGYCQVIGSQTKEEPKGFFDWLMALFGM